MVENCYLELPFSSNITEQLEELSKSIDDDKWIEYFKFDALPLNNEQIIASDKFLKDLYSQLPFKCGIVKLKSNTYYDWHKDDNRGVCINMLINNSHSHCLFRETDNVTGNFVELKYKIGVYYLFNNQVEHSVINFDSDRYLFTLEFDKDKNYLTFNDLVNKKW